jgi:acyl-CoA synthetase (AMP-forming)/AMP-acid ligase II
MEADMLLLDALMHWTKKTPEKMALSFLNEKGDVSVSLTYRDISAKSSNLASHLLKAGVTQGDRVLLVYPPSLDFIVAFLGCLKAGVIAVPTFPPDPSKLSKDIAMFSTITSSCGAKVALTSSLYNYATKVASIQVNRSLQRSLVISVSYFLFLLFALQNFLTGAGSAKWPELTWIETDKLSASPSATRY